MAIMKHLELSTSHITEETARSSETCLLTRYDYGAFFYVPWYGDDLELEGVPDDLAGVFKYAHAKHCDLVRFDVEGDIIDGLPVYAWELLEEE